MIHNTFKPLLIHADEGIVVLEENTVKSDLSEQVCIHVRSTLISSCNLFFSTNPVPVPNLEPAVCISSKKKDLRWCQKAGTSTAPQNCWAQIWTH